MYTAKKISEIIKGKLHGNANIPVKHLISDSRTIANYSESIFFALVSTRNNGHKYINDLYKSGVRCFVVSENAKLPKDCSVIKVKNTLSALQQLTAYHRQQFSLPVIAITGSNGKTMVKEWLYALLKNNFNICRSPKSYNSQIGVPLSVWNLNSEHTVAIFEAGISTTKEMPKLEKIIKPNIGVFTNLGEAHNEGFSGTKQKIAEKFLLFDNCDVIVVNGLKQAQVPAKYRKKKLIFIGTEKNSPIKIKQTVSKGTATKIELVYNSKNYNLEIPFTDSASIANAITCFGVLIATGLEPEKYYSAFKELPSIALRLEIKTGINNCVLINDFYNSDLDSLQIALNYLNQQTRNATKTVILSDIEQSGQSNKNLYKEIAKLLKRYKINSLIGIGKNISLNVDIFTIEKTFFENTSEFVNAFHSKNLRFKDSTILLKGARSFGFEKISQLLQQKSHDTILEINLNKLTENINYYRCLMKSETQIMCMVKAIGYGSGSVEIAKTLQHIGVNYLAVAYADEGVELRNAQINLPVMVMSPEEDSFEDIINYNLEPEIYSFRVLELFRKQLEKSGSSEAYPIHIKLDTGMHRLGFVEKDLDALASALLKYPQLKVRSVFSHLAGTDNPQLDNFTNEQISVFEKGCNLLQNRLEYSFIKHICNSGGTTRFKNAHYDMVRLGIGMYGVGVNANEQNKLQNVSALKTRIAQLKSIKAGETVGYNRNGKVINDMRIAVIPIGYADGFKRDLGNGKFSVYVNKIACKTIGNICMDMCMIDVTNVNCNEGDEVVIFESFGQIHNLSVAMNTIPYEVLTSISGRVKRIYIQE
ncbi:MAG TPA: bifunctional UDP-N-acetylmuramoyl-tripeptide:D-alanyl-D-alanine ligase/alanine racemase [Bacteroidia bacterium]|nr:bifunctional UDP-N-acetylmuramoyl-tripeptide:D-alanyl-D-alanine ligase/alanine racemase [Bacteroidia bacterium]